MRILLMILFLFPAAAFANCYSEAEAEAEQAIRIHSELMVIGLNCQHMTPAGRKNFYLAYRDITNRHADLFSGYESTLISYYKRQGGNAERKVHDLRTSFANIASTNVAQQRPDVFCSRNVRRISQVDAMSRGELQQWAAQSSQTQGLTRSICR